jgi:hypothetical protein
MKPPTAVAVSLFQPSEGGRVQGMIAAAQAAGRMRIERGGRALLDTKACHPVREPPSLRAGELTTRYSCLSQLTPR